LTAGAIVGISCAILFLLFVFQRMGTSKVGFTFAPIVFVWFASNVMINLYNIIIYYPGKRPTLPLNTAPSFDLAIM
jgi:KUP system potassium uptake protein